MTGDTWVQLQLVRFLPLLPTRCL